MTYLGLLGIFVGAPILLMAGRGRRPPADQVPQLPIVAVAGMALLALTAALPWDAALLTRRVWSYPHGLLLGRVAGVPVEECLFMLTQPVLVGLWARRLPCAPPLAASAGARRAGGGLWLAVAAAGAVLALISGRTTYLGWLLAWAGPALLLQWAVGGDRLWRQRRLVWSAVAPPVVYLCLVDRLALALGLWRLSPQRTTGAQLLGLPVEEALFFLLTTLLIVGGLLLATDEVALHRTRRWACSLIRSRDDCPAEKVDGRPPPVSSPGRVGIR